MDGGSWLQIFFFILLVLGGAYFASAESCFSAMNKIRVKNEADDGDKRAKNAMYIVNNFDSAITTLLIGNNITHIAAASIATVFSTRLWGEGSVTYTTIVTTVIVFLFSEMIPKAYANAHSESLAMVYAGSLRMLMKMLKPLVFFFSKITGCFSKLFENKTEPEVTEDDLYDIIDTIEDEGVIDEDQSDLFKSALDFSDTTAKDVMTMREDILAIDVDTPNDRIVEIIKNSRHSRIPIYRGTIDNVIGILLVRRYLRAYISNPRVDVSKILEKPHFITKDAKIDELLTKMSGDKIYIAMVRDDDGKTVLGLVTIEDFLEELVGEIWDEDDTFDENFIKLGGNRFKVSGTLLVTDVLKRIGVKFDPRRFRMQTVNNFIQKNIEGVPEEDDMFMFDQSLLITVDETDDNIVKYAIFRIISDKSEIPPELRKPEDIETETKPAEKDTDVPEISGKSDDNSPAATENDGRQAITK